MPGQSAVVAAALVLSLIAPAGAEEPRLLESAARLAAATHLRQASRTATPVRRRPRGAPRPPAGDSAGWGGCSQHPGACGPAGGGSRQRPDAAPQRAGRRHAGRPRLLFGGLRQRRPATTGRGRMDRDRDRNRPSGRGRAGRAKTRVPLPVSGSWCVAGGGAGHEGVHGAVDRDRYRNRRDRRSRARPTPRSPGSWPP